MYKVGIYLRISNDDGDKQESNSIASQRAIIQSFVDKHEDMILKGEYLDDGYTGTNFERPGFKKLLEDIDSGKVNCVITKDLSRLGRNYVQTGLYLEQYFPLKGVRFIAINDNYDSITSNSDNDFMMPIRNLFNANYSKDISKKVRSAFKAKQNSGEFVGAFASYGYIKDPNDRHKLIVDEEAATIVRRIFSLYSQGQGKISIAHSLNEEHIPCPSEYKKLKGMRYTNCHRMDYTTYWTYSTIHKILNNEMYTGTLVQNRSERRTVRGKATIMSSNEWIRVENTHEAIIDRETWNITQELLKRRGRQPNFFSEVGLFAGFIRCGDCGRAMTKIKHGSEVRYICGTYKWYTSKQCSSHSVKERMLESLILEKLNEEFVKLDEEDFSRPKSKKRKVDISKYKDKLAKLYKQKKDSYEDYKSGLLTKEEYFLYKEDYTKEEALVNGQMAAVLQAMEEKDERNEWVEHLKKYRRIDRLDRAVLACILDGIMVYEDDEEVRVDIRLKYML